MAHTTFYPPCWLTSPVPNSPLHELLALRMSAPLFDYVVDRLVDTVSAALDRSWDNTQQRCLKNPLLRPFVQCVLTKNRLPLATILVALVYLDKARKNLRVSPGFWACERALIGALVLANKYTNDDILSTKAWAVTSGLFTAKDVVRAERELLHVLRFDLSVREEQILVHHIPLMMRYREQSTRQMQSQLPSGMRPSGPSHRAHSHRYSPYQGAAPSRPIRRLTTRDPASSCGSTSPLDSPQLKTPPDAYPYSLALQSEPKRIHYPASHAMPYVLANTKRSISLDAPMHALDARPLFSRSYSGQPYLLADRNDFGEKSSAAQSSLLAELWQDLDPKYLSLPLSSEVKPLSLGLPFADTKNYQPAHTPARFTLGEDWYLHREQATTTPPSFENMVYAF